MEDLLSFKTLISNPFAQDVSANEHLILDGKFRSDKSLTKIASLELARMLIYCGLREESQTPTAKRVVFFYIFKKEGKNMEVPTCTITDEVVTQKMGLLFRQGNAMVSYLIGTKNGYVKIFSVGDEMLTFRIKLHTVPVVDIELSSEN